MSENKSERVVKIIVILLFVGIYLVGLVMGLQELGRKAAPETSV